jgi:Holliday junction resolvasome RuvABC endonuclease subunit
MIGTVVGIDPSLNSLGIAYRRADGEVYATCIGAGKNVRGAARLVSLRDSVMYHVRHVVFPQPSLVVLEGYAMGFGARSSSAITGMAELGGILRVALYEAGIRVMIVPPTVLKMFVTGKGNADKEAVAAALTNEFKFKFSKSDQYDAAGLLMMGEAQLNKRLLPRDARHAKRRAMQGCSFL